MAKNKYYYYDQESCAFVEVKTRDWQFYWQGAGYAGGALALALVLVWAMDAAWISTPDEAALRAENAALREQLDDVDERLQAFTQNLDRLTAKDQKLYRTLLGAEPISEDVRQVGVGGADVYDEADRFSEHTAELIRQTSRQIDKVARQLELQQASFRRLSDMAEHRRKKLAQLPVLLPANGSIVSGYGMRRDPILHVLRMHEGIDLLVRGGTPVVATGDGVVKEITRGNGYGLHVKVAHPAAGYTTLYAHLSEVVSSLEEGDQVGRGQKIALSGNTGRSTGPHLHYEIINDEGRAVNPIHFFAPTMTPAKYKRLKKQAEESGAALDY